MWDSSRVTWLQSRVTFLPTALTDTNFDERQRIKPYKYQMPAKLNLSQLYRRLFMSCSLFLQVLRFFILFSGALNIYIYIGCPRRNVPDFGRVFLMLKYTDITQNTYFHSWTVTEIMAREVWNFDSCYTLIDYQINIKTGRNMWFL
jgi:hypothetical protein